MYQYQIRFRFIYINKYLFFSSQTELSPDDENSDCVHYPTESFSSYADCDQDFVRRILPQGLVPFWTVDDPSQATNYYSTQNGQGLDHSKVINIISTPHILGICLSFYISIQVASWVGLWNLTAKFLARKQPPPSCPGPPTCRIETPAQSSSVITFTHYVPVTAVTVDTLDIMTLLNFLGSNLGLWPGMGLFQMLEGAIGLIAVYNVMEKLK